MTELEAAWLVSLGPPDPLEWSVGHTIPLQSRLILTSRESAREDLPVRRRDC